MKKMSIKSILITLLKLAIIVGAFAYLLHGGQLNFADLRAQFSHLRWLIPGVICVFVPMIVSFYRHLILLRALGITIYSFRDLLRLGFIGAFFGTFMPGAMGGDIIKAGYLIRDTGQPAVSIASLVTDRVFGLFGLLVVGGVAIVAARAEVMHTPDLHKIAVIIFGAMGTVVASAGVSLLALARGRRSALIAWFFGAAAVAIGILWILHGAHWNWRMVRSPLEPLTPELAGLLLRGRFVIAMIIGMGCALVAAIVAPSCLPGRTLSRLIKNRIPGGAAMMKFVEALLMFRENLSALVYALLLSLVTQAVNIFAVFFICRAMALSAPPTLFAIFFAAPMAFIANSLPVPGGGLGVGETAFASVLALCRDLNGETIIGGAAIFLAWRLWSVLISFSGGLPYYLRGKQEISTVAAIGERYEKPEKSHSDNFKTQLKITN